MRRVEIKSEGKSEVTWEKEGKTGNVREAEKEVWKVMEFHRRAQLFQESHGIPWKEKGGNLRRF